MRKYRSIAEFRSLRNQLLTKYPNQLDVGIINGFLFVRSGRRYVRIYDGEQVPSLHEIELRLGL